MTFFRCSRTLKFHLKAIISNIKAINLIKTLLLAQKLMALKNSWNCYISEIWNGEFLEWKSLSLPGTSGNLMILLSLNPRNNSKDLLLYHPPQNGSFNIRKFLPSLKYHHQKSVRKMFFHVQYKAKTRQVWGRQLVMQFIAYIFLVYSLFPFWIRFSSYWKNIYYTYIFMIIMTIKTTKQQLQTEKYI